METLATIMGYTGTALALFGFESKKQNVVIVSLGLSNVAFAASYVLLGSGKIIGGIACFIAFVQTFINFHFIKQGDNPPRWLTPVFFVLYCIGTAISAVFAGFFNFPMGLFPLLCAALYLLATSTNKDMLMRIFFLGNNTVWILYDVLEDPFSLPSLITHILCVLSTMLGIFKVLWGKKKKESNE